MNMEQLKAYLISEVRRTADSLSEEAVRRQRFTALSTLASNLDGLPDDHPNLFFVWYAWHKQDRRASSLPEPTKTTASLIDGYGTSARDYDFTVTNTMTGFGQRIRGDQPIVKINMWSIDRTYSLEPYIAISLKPGETKRWTYTYDYFGPGDRQAGGKP